MTPRFRWVDNEVVVELTDDDQAILAQSLPQFRELVMADDLVDRLKPPAHANDPEAEAEYRNLVDDDLLRSRLEAIEAVETALSGARLDDTGVNSWLQTLNGLRLVLAERLDLATVGTDPFLELDDDDPELPIFLLYEFFTFLQHDLLDAASNSLDP